ncbi:aspartate-semialdehyde dehydrogenase [Dongshaea marina]|uniref:aspartate-semialdehyde dehydrogenase n=1 Tax=Dongshaea marina TaxID=2047966 RepID=UPI000D3EC201|nr:aspartate-semialdehyde dehydrogenase [Dongshaea marina]
MQQSYRVAVLGASGAVGRMLIELLEEREFPVAELFPLASSRSAGTNITFQGEELEVLDVEGFDWSNVELCFFSAGGEASRRWVPEAVDAGAVVIDNTSEFRYEEDIPLVVPEVNPDAIAGYRQRGVIANPNCSTIQMLVALKPIFDQAGIERINVATYQSVSGAGQSGVDELASQTAALLNARPVKSETFAQQIAFNALPHIDRFLDNGYTKEEMKMVWETHKIFGDPSIGVNPTCVRIPVFHGHAEAIHLETRIPFDAEQAKSVLRDAPGVTLCEDAQEYPTQVTHAAGEDSVFVGRIRDDISHPNGLSLWVVADNIRKGAATNAIQIAEELVKHYWH